MDETGRSNIFSKSIPGPAVKLVSMVIFPSSQGLSHFGVVLAIAGVAHRAIRGHFGWTPAEQNEFKGPLIGDNGSSVLNVSKVCAIA